jgi:hypothetical protein
VAYQRKTRDVWIIQQNWGFGDGWEDVSAEDSRADARRAVKEYRDNQPECPVRIKKTRERIEPATI